MRKYILLLSVCFSYATAFAVTPQNRRNIMEKQRNIMETAIGEKHSRWFEENFLDQKKFEFYAQHRRHQRNFFALFKKRVSLTKKHMGDKTVRAISNFVEIRNDEYLVTRAPLKKQALHRFWSNILDAKSSLIITLLQPREGKTIKCFPYWTTKVLVKDWWIQKTNETVIARGIRNTSIIERTFIAKNRTTHEARTIRQLHYTKWLDCHQTPDVPLLLKLVKRAEEIAITSTPITVHCTAGRGRTSAFVLLHANRSHIHHDTPQNFLKDMLFSRLQRRGFVSKKQFAVFCDIFSRPPTK